MSDEVRIELRDGWRKLMLNRPDKLNAANEAMLTALMPRCDAAAVGSRCRALLLTGEGRGFCAGQELGAAVMPGPGGPPDLGAVAELHHRLVRRLRAVPMPVVCAVNGVAAGAGASYALACDIVLAARSAKFIQAFVKIGLVPDSGASFFLPRLIGEARARALAMLGETLDAERAEDWGMIWKVVDDAALQQEAEALTGPPGEAADGGAGGHEAHVCCVRHAMGCLRSSTWSGTSRRGGAPRGLCRGCARIRGEACAAISGADMSDIVRARRRGDVGGGSRQLRSGHASGRSRTGPRATVDDNHRDDDERPRHLPWRFHLHAGELGDGVRGQSARRAGGRAARVDHVCPPGAALARCWSRTRVERMHAGRSGMYDVRVSTAEGELVAEFRGHTRTIQARRRQKAEG